MTNQCLYLWASKASNMLLLRYTTTVPTCGTLRHHWNLSLTLHFFMIVYCRHLINCLWLLTVGLVTIPPIFPFFLCEPKTHSVYFTYKLSSVNPVFARQNKVYSLNIVLRVPIESFMWLYKSTASASFPQHQKCVLSLCPLVARGDLYIRNVISIRPKSFTLLHFHNAQ